MPELAAVLAPAAAPIMQDIYIVGVGMTPFGRHLDQTEKQLTAQAVEDALRDAACERKWLGAAFYGNCGQGYMQGQHMIRGQVALLPLGLRPAHSMTRPLRATVTVTPTTASDSLRFNGTSHICS